MTTRIITGMELKYPDDEDKKNSVCRPMKVAQNPEDYFSCFLAHTSCQAAATQELGVWHMSSTRVNLLHHLPWTTQLKIIYLFVVNLPSIFRRLRMLVEQIENENKIKGV